MLPKPHSLQTRFLIGLLIMMACVGGLSAFSLNNHLRQLMENEARDRAALILAQAEAIQSYVRNTLRPALYGVLSEDQFIIEGMSSSFVTRAVMSEPSMVHDRFLYRRVTRGARNPAYEARDKEVELLERFRSDSALSKLEEIAVLDGESRFITAKPVYFEPACLRCHGDPDLAPRALTNLYGRERGFWRSAGELAGMTMVALPLNQAVSGVRDAVMSFAILFGVSMMGLFLIIQMFFNRLVVHNMKRMGAVMHQHFSDETDAELFDHLHRQDEIEDLMTGLEALIGHLHDAREQLRQYAANLETMVEARTVDLATEANARQADVELFVSLLDGLNAHAGKSELLGASLALVARRFGADMAAYACVLGVSDRHVWPAGREVPALPVDWTVLVAEGQPRLTPEAWYIPVQTAETSRGLLCLYWGAPARAGSRAVELAQAVGQQIGVVMDNIEAMDNLLRQNALLDSIFEGISDPLLLLDAEGRPRLANSSAKSLFRAEFIGDAIFDSEKLRALSGGQETLSLPDGRSFSVHSYALTGRKEGGGHVIYLRETTDEKRMLERAQQQEKLAAVGKLAAGLAHEINNPLGVILCHAELLRDAAEDAQARADVEMIVRHTEQAQKVLRDLLDFSRLKVAKLGPCDLDQVVTGMADIFRPRLRSQRVRLELDLSSSSRGEALPDIRADRDVLEQIFTNILINALDALEGSAGALGGGLIRVRTWHQGYEVLASIADSGPGIPEEHLARIFDPFFTTKDVGRGTGLGLSVVFGLMRDMGGRIEVQSTRTVAGGAEFVLSFPVMDESLQEGARQ